MKSKITGLVIFLILLFIAGGLKAVWDALVILGNGVFSLARMMLTIIVSNPIPNSVFELFQNIIRDEWALTNIQWIDNTLVTIASILPPIIIFLVSTLGLKLSPKITAPLSLIMFVVILFLFQSIIFWVILSIIILFLIAIVFLNQKNDYFS